MTGHGDPARRLVLVVGVGRSGTSLLTGILGQLGLHIPQPEVRADETTPRGFGEPRWAVKFHTRLLQAHGAMVNDARPAAWDHTRAAAEDERAVTELREWLAGHFAGSGAVVVKDPRTSWFLPLWTQCAAELGVQTAFVTMLRHPAEILASARKSYGDRLTMAGRAAAWVNVTLETERATRGATRAYVRHEDLLADWKRELTRVREVVGLPELSQLDPERVGRADAFVDPSLHRSRVGWDDLGVPDHLREMAEAVWRDLQPLAGDGGDDATVHHVLDGRRREYARLYADAEAIAESSVRAVRRRRVRPGDGLAADAAPSLRVRVTRRVPARYRRRLRHAVRALTRS